MTTRRLALLILMTAAAAGCETGAPSRPIAPLEHIQVHEVIGRTKQELCNAARDWAAMTFKDSSAVVEVFDAEQGKMIGKGRTTVPFMGTAQPIDFTLIVECRDGRARATFADPLMTGPGGQKLAASTSPSAAFRANVLTELGRIDALLATYLKNPRVGGKW